jgi:hypothetical protein
VALGSELLLEEALYMRGLDLLEEEEEEEELNQVSGAG